MYYNLFKDVSLEDMMKKLYMLLFIISLLVFNAALVYGNDNYKLENYLEVINPSVEKDGEVLIKENLFISMNIKSDEKTYLTIKKIIPVMDEIYIDKIIDGELDKAEFTKNILVKMNEINEEFKKEEYTSKEIDNIKNIISEYIESYINKEELDKSIKSIEKEISTNNDEVSKLDMIEKKNKLKEDYKEISDTFLDRKEKYDDLFKIVILEDDPIKSSGVVPYYEKNIKDVSSGSYEIIIELKDEDTRHLLKKIDFEIKSKDEKDKESSEILDNSMKLIQPAKDVKMEE